MWLMNGFLCRSLLARPDSCPILLLDGEALISRPQDTVFAAADFLGLIADDASHSALENLQPLVATRQGRASGLTAPAPERPSLPMREARCGDEVAAATAWAGKVAGDWLSQSRFPIE